MTDKKIRPFGKKDELGYVFGDMAGSFVNLFYRCLLPDILYVCTRNQPCMDGIFIPLCKTLGCDQRPDYGIFPGSLDDWKIR